MKLDVLAIGAHPDDVELTCSGTVILMVKKGRKVGIVDLTRGELGTRGSAEIRDQEAADATKIMGLSARVNLGMRDGFISNDESSRLKVVQVIRRYQPDIVLCNSFSDRHPDHGVASKLVSDAVFLSGLHKLLTHDDGNRQSAWKVRSVYHYIQDRYLKPDFTIDVSSVWNERMEALKAFKSQFYNPESQEPESAISSKAFLDFIEARAREFGRPTGVPLAEAFQVERTPGVRDLFDLY
ncbi:MAG: bacillithiol biosynthesis deacetylase BshB1 [Bacteroidota bacterium]